MDCSKMCGADIVAEPKDNMSVLAVLLLKKKRREKTVLQLLLSGFKEATDTDNLSLSCMNY